MTTLSVLDLVPIVEGGDAADALAGSLALAQTAEAAGYRRYWIAEHHNMTGVGGAATAVVVGHIAAGTRTIRVGAGGIMLPNHAPLVVAEQFGTLAALHPGRIDLGLGRAPGADMNTARALRRTLVGEVDRFPQDVLELQSYFAADDSHRQVRAVPGVGLEVPLWILGSSTYGAQLAAALGLPYAFASHFAPAEMEAALQVYRAGFRPSAQCARPHVMLGLNVFAADTDAEARRLYTSLQQAFVNLRTARPGPLPAPREGYAESLDPMALAMLNQALACSVVGAPTTVRAGVAAFAARTGADELMITAQIHDLAARRRSFEIAAEANSELARAA